MTKKILTTIFLFFFFTTQPIFAHPLDEISGVSLYDQEQHLTISPDQVELTIKMTFYSVEKIKVWESIDTNADRNISEEESTKWKSKGQKTSWLEANNQQYYFTANKISFPDYYDFFAPKPAVVTIDFISPTSLPLNQNISYHYQGKDKKLSQISFGITTNDFIATTPQIQDSQVSFSLEPGSGSTMKLPSKTSSRLNTFLNTYIKTEKLSWSLLLTALISAFIIGAFHALTPGHGKAIIAGYLVGSQGKTLHALYLGLIITITHTASVFLLGLGSLMFTQSILPDQIIKILTRLSGLLIVLLGSILVYQRWPKQAQNIPYTPVDELDNPNTYNQTITWKNLLTLGISGGIIPCADALAILIIAISLHKIYLGLIMLISFSLGLAVALIIMGALALQAKNQLSRRIKNLENYQQIVSLLSAIIVTIIGAYLLLKP